jgi:hypothetical protein
MPKVFKRHFEPKAKQAVKSMVLTLERLLAMIGTYVQKPMKLTTSDRFKLTT